MPMFYFTYGTDDEYPYRGGWTEVRAMDHADACRTFRQRHPSRPGTDLLNCAFVYLENDFKNTEMFKENDNLGAGCHETLVSDGVPKWLAYAEHIGDEIPGLSKFNILLGVIRSETEDGVVTQLVLPANITPEQVKVRRL